MPTQRRRIGSLLAFLGNMDSFAVHGVIVPAVVELLFDPPTDLEMQVGCHRHVSGVQQAVDFLRCSWPPATYDQFSKGRRLNQPRA